MAGAATMLLGIVAAIGISLAGPPAWAGSHFTSTNVAVVPSYSGYGSAGYLDPASYPGVTMTQVDPSSVTSAADLAGYDTVILWQFCNVSSYPAFTTALMDWMKTYGGKVIIWDSDSCNTEDYTGADYSWLSPLGATFQLFTPGQTGSTGGALAFAEITHLGSPNPASPFFIDTTALVQGSDAVGDVNVVDENTVAPAWCALMRGTNIMGQAGYAHMYSGPGNLVGAPDALIIYCGLDTDYIGYAVGQQMVQMLNLELQHGWGPSGSPEVADLLCQAAVGNLVVAPSKAYNMPGLPHTVTATVTIQDPNTGNTLPLSGVLVSFVVTSGPNMGVSGSGVTDADGHAAFTYTGQTPGTDVIQASCTVNSVLKTYDVAKVWIDLNDIRLVKNDLAQGTNVGIGEIFTYEISFSTFSNTVAAVNLQIVDDLPAELDFISATTNGALSMTYNSGLHEVVWDFGTWPPLTAGPTNYLTVQVNAGANLGQTIVNYATMVCSNLPPVSTRTRNPRTVSTNCPLVLVCPNDMVLESLNEAGAVASFTAAATDSCSQVTIYFTPPSGSMFPFGVTPVQVVAVDESGNSAQCTFNVTVLGANWVKSDVLSAVVALRATVTNRADLWELYETIRDLKWALMPCVWVDETHVTRCNGRWVFCNEIAAVKELQDLTGYKNSYKNSIISSNKVQNFIDPLVKIDRLLAVVNIQDAAKAGASSKKVAWALAEVALGDQYAASGKPGQAIQHYWNAWYQAFYLNCSVAPPNVWQAIQLEFPGIANAVYKIQESDDMLTWRTIGKAKADSTGTIKFTDTKVSINTPWIYRVVKQ